MYDVIIVGARCAGSALALLLARGGHKVLMVDRTVFPSDTMSGHFIQPAGIACLKRWGVLERLTATDTPAQTTMTLDAGPIVLTAQPTPMADGTDIGYGPRRYLFDPLLAAAAIEAGVEFWDGFMVKQPLFSDGEVVGIAGVTRSGRSIEVRSKLVVGADGKRSRIAAAVGAAIYHQRPASTCVYYSYWEDFDAPHTRLFLREGQFAVALPTNRGLTSIAMMWPIAEFARVRADIARGFDAATAQLPWLADRMADAKRVERFIGTADLDGFFRTSHGPGWALLGDAGYHRDPITAQGMTDAFCQAELLAQAIDAGLTGGMPMPTALAAYQRQRDEMARPMFELTHDLAQLKAPVPEMAALMEALQHDAPATQRFFGVMAGTVAVGDFFRPQNIDSILCKRRVA